MNPQQIIKNYFNCWITQDFSQLTDYFHEKIIYRECYGPVYIGLSEIKQWIADMLKKQTVLEWKIDRIMEVAPDIFVVEWFFHAKETTEYEFDGVSIIEFSEGKISRISEFEAKHQTYRPYENS